MAAIRFTEHVDSAGHYRHALLDTAKEGSRDGRHLIQTATGEVGKKRSPEAYTTRLGMGCVVLLCPMVGSVLSILGAAYPVRSA